MQKGLKHTACRGAAVLYHTEVNVSCNCNNQLLVLQTNTYIKANVLMICVSSCFRHLISVNITFMEGIPTWGKADLYFDIGTLD